jgi:hypothetical protein
MATRKNLKKTGKKRIKPKGGAKKRKTVRGGVFSFLKRKKVHLEPAPGEVIDTTTYSVLHDQTKQCDVEAMEFFTDLIDVSEVNKQYIDAWIDDVNSNQPVKDTLIRCVDKNKRSLLYHAIGREIFELIPFLIEELQFKPTIEDIQMEIKLFLNKDPYQNYDFKPNKSGSYKLDYKNHEKIMDLLVTETTLQVNLDYIIGLATCKTPNILIILTMLNEKGKLSINSVSEENQRKLLLILFNMKDSEDYIIPFGLQKYFELLEFIISTFKFDLNITCQGSDTILHTLVKEYFTTFTNFRLSNFELENKKTVFFGKINFLIEHGADINIKNKDGKTIFDLFEDIKTDNNEDVNKRQKDYETEITVLRDKQMVSKHKGLP